MPGFVVLRTGHRGVRVGWSGGCRSSYSGRDSSPGTLRIRRGRGVAARDAPPIGGITDRLANVIGTMHLGVPSDWVFRNLAGNQVAGNKTLQRLKRYALEAEVLVETRPHTASLIRWHWLRHYHRTRAHVRKIRREVSKVTMGYAGDAIHDHYRGLDTFAFHEEYAKYCRRAGLMDRLA